MHVIIIPFTTTKNTIPVQITIKVQINLIRILIKMTNLLLIIV